jgi:GPH family glycoside/pentoside/hexuronide:cation symporter
VFREILAYGLSAVGVNTGALLCISFLSVYYTDVAGISAAAVGTIYLVSRVLDGFTDLTMGVIVDKTHTRWGKARPWMVIGGIGSALMTILVFNIPRMDAAAMVVYAGITYFLLFGVFNTMAGISTYAMTAFISDSSKDRTALGSSFFVIQIIISGAVTVLSIQAVSLLGGGQHGWTVYTFILAATAVVFLFISVLNIKERFAPKKPKNSITFRAIINALRQNRYFFLITLAGLFLNVASGLMTGVGVYYATYLLGNAELFGLLGIFAFIPSLPGIPLSVALISKFGKCRVVVWGQIISLIGCVVIFLRPVSIPWIIAGLVLKGLGGAPFLASYNAFAADAADYGQWKTGASIHGVIFSGTSFGNKVGVGLAGAMTGWILALTGYVGVADIQPKPALDAISMLFSIIPAVPGVIIVLLILPFKKLEQLQPRIEAELHGTGCRSN